MSVLPDVIIPAHNESATVAAVVDAARRSGRVGAIIVVSDASTDGTPAEAAGADLVLPVHYTDKGSAVAAGLAHSDSALVMLLDADLAGLLPGHVAALATRGPMHGQCVGLRGNRAWLGGLPSISGERRLPRDVLELVDPAGCGWQLETRCNATVGRLGLPWRHLGFTGVTNPTKLDTDPAGWLLEMASVAGAMAANLPGLVDYTLHPEGRSTIASTPVV